MPYASDNTLYADDRSALGTFSSHWAACAAMIRLSDPTFVSMGGDKPADLEVERRIHERLGIPPAAGNTERKTT